MFKQINVDKSTILGSTDVGRVIKPYLIGSIKRNNPDMSSTVPYFPALNTKTLSMRLEGTVNTTYNVTFTGNSMTQALADINSTVGSDAVATDVNGYLCITSNQAGNRNLLKILSGTATAILGFEIDPHPSSICYAGEIDSGKPTFYENRSKGSTSLISNEPVQKDVFNRFGAGLSYILDTVLSNLDREISVPKEYSVAIAGASFTIASPDRFFLSTNNIFSPNPSADDLEGAVTLLDSTNNLVFDSSGNRVRITSITYGNLVDASTTFTAWGTADGKSVFGGLSHYQKVKSTHSITSIVGNIIKCVGATFQTDKVQQNDVLIISGATNLTPFNPNGQFIVDEILSEEILRVRPSGTSDTALIPGTLTPSSLNNKLQVGETYGTATIYLGKFCPLQMKNGNMTFNLSSSLTGTYKVILPIGRTLKQLTISDLSQYLLPKESGGQIELGSKLVTTLANALKARIIAKPNQDTAKTLLAEFKNGTIGCRIYTLLAGGIEITYNAKWDGAAFVKDDGTKDVCIIKEDVNGVFLLTDSLASSLVPATGKIVEKYQTAYELSDGTNITLSAPAFTGTTSGHLQVKSGVDLGTGLTNETQALVPKVRHTVTNTSGKYTQLDETLNSAARRREYVMADGTEVLTLNSKFDGTNWVKDIAANQATKLVLDPLGLKIYGQSSNTASFADTAWQSLDEVKNWIIDDDFMYPRELSVNDSIGDIVSHHFYASLATNTKRAQGGGVDPVVGELVMSSVAGAAFSTTYSTVKTGIDSSSDFEIRVKVKCPTPAILDAYSLMEEGLFLGFYDSGSNTPIIALRANSDKSFWLIDDGVSTFNSAVAPTTYCKAVFRRINGVLKVYINNTQVYSDTNSDSLSLRSFRITATGTATGASQEIAKIDYVRIWVGEISR